MLGLLPRRLPGRSEDRIYELGSGWGGVAVALAERYPERTVVGYELSVLPWLFADLRNRLGRRPNLTFRLADFRSADLSDAALCVCYLAGSSMAELAGKFERELQPGALVLSNTFALRRWQPLERVEAPDRFRSPVYLYEAIGPDRGDERS